MGRYIGAKDNIDKLLVKKYASEKVDNPIIATSMVSPEKMMAAMQDYSMVTRNMFVLQQKLKKTCDSVNAANAQYRKATFAR